MFFADLLVQVHAYLSFLFYGVPAATLREMHFTLRVKCRSAAVGHHPLRGRCRPNATVVKIILLIKPRFRAPQRAQGAVTICI